jgi:hypothetical protein
VRIVNTGSNQATALTTEQMCDCDESLAGGGQVFVEMLAAGIRITPDERARFEVADTII